MDNQGCFQQQPALNRDATSIRQLSEWGMRAFQSAFPRVQDRLRHEDMGERCLILHSLVFCTTSEDQLSDSIKFKASTCQTYREWQQVEERIASNGDGEDKRPGHGLTRLRKILDDGWWFHADREAKLIEFINDLRTRVCGPEDPCQLYADVIDDLLGNATA